MPIKSDTGIPAATGPPTAPTGGLDIRAMAPAVQGYFQEGLAPSTHRTYNAAMRQFHKFCTQFNVHSPFPVTEYLLCCYASFLANRSLTPQTINSYLSAVRNMQITLGLPDPREKSSLPMLKRVQAGIKRVRLLRGAPHRIRLPITASVLEKIRLHLNKFSHTHSILIWSICCMAFFVFFPTGRTTSRIDCGHQSQGTLDVGRCSHRQQRQHLNGQNTPQTL